MTGTRTPNHLRQIRKHTSAANPPSRPLNADEVTRAAKIADLRRRGIIIDTETPTRGAPHFAARTRKGTVT